MSSVTLQIGQLFLMNCGHQELLYLILFFVLRFLNICFIERFSSKKLDGDKDFFFQVFRIRKDTDQDLDTNYLNSGPKHWDPYSLCGSCSIFALSGNSTFQ